MIQAVTLHLVFFTEFIPDPQMQYKMGFSMIGFISVLMMANLLMVGYKGGRDVVLIVYKYYKKFRRFLDPDYMRIK